MGVNLTLKCEMAKWSETKEITDSLIQGLKMDKEKIKKVIDRIEDDLISVKKEAGLIVQAEITFNGIKGDNYVFAQMMPDDKNKLFYCNPDDVEFYTMAILKAIEMDKTPELRKRRLENKGESDAEKIPSVKPLSSIDEAIKGMRLKLDENKTTSPKTTDQ